MHGCASRKVSSTSGVLGVQMKLNPGQIEVVEDAMAEVLRRKTPAERIAIGFSLWRSANRILTAHLGTSHPDWGSDRVQREVAKRLSHGAA